MANVIPFAFRGELFTGTHNFASGGDQFKLALYTSTKAETASLIKSCKGILPIALRAISCILSSLGKVKTGGTS